MPANQNHGFLWEAEIKTKVFQITEAARYTATHDVDKQRNPFNPRENVSIKVTGSDTVCMGDALRVFSYAPEDIHTGVVVRYTQDDTTKRLTNVYELDLDNRQLLWGDVTREDIVSLVGVIRSMPPGPRDPVLDAQITQMKTALNAKSGVMKFNPKLDSKTQRRLQCSIPGFADVPGLIRMSTTECVVRGIHIAMTIASRRRVRRQAV
jgi:hypothetical protein